MNASEDVKVGLMSIVGQKTKEILVFEGHRKTEFRTIQRYESLIRSHTPFTKIDQCMVIDQDKRRQSIRKQRPLFICRRG